MNDPQALRFVNEEVRPLAEYYRALLHRVAAAKERYDLVYGTLTADLNADVEDGREAEGVSRLTCNDVVSLMNHLVAATNDEAVNTAMRALVAKHTVRPLRID
jgi:hypothetical protein